jgi:DNA replication protein DnaC
MKSTVGAVSASADIAAISLPSARRGQEASDTIVGAEVREHCRLLHLPTIGSQCEIYAGEATRSGQSHLRYLEAVLAAEREEREMNTIQRLIKEAHLPRPKTMQEFDFAKAPQVSATQMMSLAAGSYLTRSEPVIFIGDSGTGKTHLATALCVSACRQRKRVRFVTAAGLVNELVEAQQTGGLSRALARWARYDLIALDEVGYVPLADQGAELLFQVVADRAEKAAIVITTNLPFSEWTQVFTNIRLCKALLDRLTDRAHLIETGSESYRFRRTLEGRQYPPQKLRGPRTHTPQADQSSRDDETGDSTGRNVTSPNSNSDNETHTSPADDDGTGETDAE